MEANCSEKN